MIEQVLQARNLYKAYGQIRQNRGSAGLDGMSVEALGQHLDESIKRLISEIESHQYEAQPILGVAIPKGNGKTRQLGVPTVTDRVLQQALSQIMAMRFEPEFKAHSYGFRPGKNAHQAVYRAKENINEGYGYIVDIDLEKFFDQVDHCILLQLIYRKVKCRTTLWLIRKWLRAPVQIGGRLVRRRRGIPQGSPLSPLLSNIMLHELDRELEKRGHRYVRYADDFSVYTKSRAEARAIGNELYRYLRDKLKLPINRAKSGIRKPSQFQILGYGFVPSYVKGEKGIYQLVVSAKAWKRLKTKLKEITRKTTPASLSERLARLESIKRGWLNYFRMASIQQKLQKLDTWLRNRLRYCIWHHWKKPERKRKNLIRLGVNQGQAYAWSRTRMGGWAVAQSPILRTTITLSKLRKRGYISLSELYRLISPTQAPLFNEPLYTRPVRTVV